MTARLSFFLTGLSTLVRLICGLIVTKIVAITMGASGLALHGNLMNFSSLITTVGSMSTQTGITKLIAGSKSEEERKAVLFNAITMTVVSMIIVTFICVIFQRQLQSFIFGNYINDHIIYIMLITAWFTSANLLMIALMNGFRKFKRLSIGNCSIALMPALVFLVFRDGLDLEVLIYGYLISTVVASIILLYLSRNYFDSLSIESFVIDGEYIKRIVRFGVATLLCGVIISTSMILVRNTIIAQDSNISGAGLWESLYRIAAYYNLFVYSPLVVYYLPMFTKMLDVEKRYAYIRLLIAGVFTITALSYMFSDVISLHLVQIIYSDEFVPIVPYVKYILVAEGFRVMGSILHLELIVGEKVYSIVSIELCAHLILVSAFIFLLDNFGFSLMNCVYGYSMCTLGFLCLNVFRYLSIRYQKKIQIG